LSCCDAQNTNGRTPAEIGRLKGEWERLRSRRGARPSYPQFAARVPLTKPCAPLQGIYTRGGTAIPRFLAVERTFLNATKDRDAVGAPRTDLCWEGRGGRRRESLSALGFILSSRVLGFTRNLLSSSSPRRNDLLVPAQVKHHLRGLCAVGITQFAARLEGELIGSPPTCGITAPLR